MLVGSEAQASPGAPTSLGAPASMPAPVCAVKPLAGSLARRQRCRRSQALSRPRQRPGGRQLHKLAPSATTPADAKRLGMTRRYRRCHQSHGPTGGPQQAAPFGTRRRETPASHNKTAAQPPAEGATRHSLACLPCGTGRCSRLCSGPPCPRFTRTPGRGVLAPLSAVRRAGARAGPRAHPNHAPPRTSGRKPCRPTKPS